VALPFKLASQSAVIFSARIFGAGLMFVTQAAVARFWGPAVLGEYLLVIATASLIAAFLPLGFQTIGTYFAAEYRAKGQGRLIWRFAFTAYGQWLLMAVLLVLFGLSALRLAGPTGAVVSTHFPAVAAIAGTSAVMFINSSLLVGLKRPFAGYFADTLIRPTLVMAGFIITLTVLDGGIAEMLDVFATGYAVMGVLHLGLTVWTLRRLPDAGRSDFSNREIGRWWRFALPWVMIALATDYFFDIDLVALSTLLPAADLAIFGVCARIFTLTAFGVAAVYAVTLPDVFEAEAMSDRKEFHRRIGDANMVAAGLSLALFAGAGLLGPFALLLFGNGFLAGSGPLAVLCLALVVRSACGPTSLVLSIHDHPYASLPVVAAGLLTLIAVNLALVPAFGLMGASIAALIAIAVWSGGLWFITYRITGIDVSIVPRLLNKDRGAAKMASAK
jgi:O-antigen/teichoic acid export membrane protein